VDEKIHFSLLFLSESQSTTEMTGTSTPMRVTTKSIKNGTIFFPFRASILCFLSLKQHHILNHTNLVLLGLSLKILLGQELNGILFSKGLKTLS
jgi:hypothetical protein